MRIHVINGRFQPFHDGHLGYAKAAARDCDLLVVGLTHVPGLLGDDGLGSSVAPHRHEEGSNPLSFAERTVVIDAAIDACDEIDCRVVFVPFPIEEPLLIPAFIPLQWRILTTLHESWNEKKVETIRELGYDVSIVCEDEDKVIRGKDIRETMRAGSDHWRGSVPPAAAAALDRLGVPERMVEGNA